FVQFPAKPGVEIKIAISDAANRNRGKGTIRLIKIPLASEAFEQRLTLKKQAFDRARAAKRRGDMRSARQHIMQGVKALTTIPTSGRTLEWYQDVEDAGIEAFTHYQAAEAARDAFSEMTQWLQRVMLPTQANIFNAQAQLAGMQQVTGNLDAALITARAAVNGLSTCPPEDTEIYDRARGNLAQIYMGLHDFDRAHELFLAIHADRTRRLPKDHDSLLRAKYDLGHSFLRRGDFRKGAALWKTIRVTLERGGRQNEPFYHEVLFDLAVALKGQMPREDALATMEKSYAAVSKIYPRNAGKLIYMRHNIAEIKGEMGRTHEALQGARENLRSMLATRPADDPAVQETRVILADRMFQ
ncbi:MAG: tetratricopeptide repeat protein, partial [Verrucomicrobiota bacterium]